MNNLPLEPATIANLDDLILRTPCRLLSKEEILSQEIQHLTEVMKVTMRNAQGVGLAAPQIRFSLQMIVVEDKKEYFKDLSENEVLNQERVEIPFHVLFNPKITFLSKDIVDFYEECLSYPGWMAIVPRAKTVCVEYLNEKGELCQITAEGWHSRILQHEIDHINGVLFLDRAKKHSLCRSVK